MCCRHRRQPRLLVPSPPCMGSAWTGIPVTRKTEAERAGLGKRCFVLKCEQQKSQKWVSAFSTLVPMLGLHRTRPQPCNSHAHLVRLGTSSLEMQRSLRAWCLGVGSLSATRPKNGRWLIRYIGPEDESEISLDALLRLILASNPTSYYRASYSVPMPKVSVRDRALHLI